MYYKFNGAWRNNSTMANNGTGTLISIYYAFTLSSPCSLLLKPRKRTSNVLRTIHVLGFWIPNQWWKKKKPYWNANNRIEL